MVVRRKFCYSCNYAVITQDVLNILSHPAGAAAAAGPQSPSHCLEQLQNDICSLFHSGFYWVPCVLRRTTILLTLPFPLHYLVLAELTSRWTAERGRAQASIQHRVRDAAAQGTGCQWGGGGWAGVRRGSRIPEMRGTWSEQKRRVTFHQKQQ